ncbi:MAG: nitroreductase family protein [Kiritimatiellae bacterium]|nr:nitroreductase family protein [Kiritimatiellia bacterium]
MSRIKIDEARCTRCGKCIRVCPLGLLKGDANTATYLPSSGDAVCIACGHCLAACPRSAIAIDNVAPEACEVADVPLPGFEDVRRLVMRRRSMRLYQQRPVPKDEIARLIDAVRWAPTARNNQQVGWVVVMQPERVREAAGQVVEFLRARQEVPALTSAWDHGYDMVLRGAPHLVIAHGPAETGWSATDCAIALTTFELLARSAGLGTCWAGFFTWAASGQPSIAEALGVPEGHKAYGALMLGYPLSAVLRVPPRKEASVHWV